MIGRDELVYRSWSDSGQTRARLYGEVISGLAFLEGGWEAGALLGRLVILQGMQAFVSTLSLSRTSEG